MRGLLVSSQQLAAASPVFAKMFGPNFAEGQHLSPSELKEVPLPEDSFPVMLILCNLIHWNHDSVPLELSPEEIYGISTSVDKYDCIAVTQLTSNVWFGNALKLSLRGKGLFQWLEASYLFNSATGFKAVSAYWLLHWKADNIMFLEEPESDGGSLRALSQ